MSSAGQILAFEITKSDRSGVKLDGEQALGRRQLAGRRCALAIGRTVGGRVQFIQEQNLAAGRLAGRLARRDAVAVAGQVVALRRDQRVLAGIEIFELKERLGAPGVCRRGVVLQFVASL